MTENLQHSQEVIKSLYENYKDDIFIVNKLNVFIQQLEHNLETAKREREEKLNKQQDMENYREEFINNFLETNYFYYCSTSELFFKYDGLNFKVSTENIVINDVLSAVTKSKVLLPCKQRTKTSVVKKIKEQDIKQSIPESVTIQNVLESLTPMFFRNKAEAKYFLSVIGDNILKKPLNLTHFINPNAKQFIRVLNNQCQKYFEVDLQNTLKYKYKDHEYGNCRILSINESINNENLWNTMLDKQSLNILCVACHYSDRYGDSDTFVKSHCHDSKLTDKIMYIANTDSDKLINEFVDTNIDKDQTQIIQNKTNKNTLITWKNMQYLWKQFLERKNIPSIIFMNSLKGKLIVMFQEYYDTDSDCFYHLCSKNLPSIQKFIDFWNTQMEIEITETDLEIDELLTLFKKWSNISINEEQMIDLLTYYFPTIEIDDGKYIQGMKCKLWDKPGDISFVLNAYRNTMKEKYIESNFTQHISLYDLYIHYCRAMHTISHKLIANKMYFEKQVNESFQEYIIDNKFLKNDWYMQDW
jgi:hypothetical protein|uniref:Uncharacterized protein n=1 Tax=viral metagenome TaxID=1070528 RepID=A0A6C0IPW0_9ZZZZ